MSFLNPPFCQSNGPYYTFLKPLYICTACDVTSIDDPYHYDILALLFLHDSIFADFKRHSIILVHLLEKGLYCRPESFEKTRKYKLLATEKNGFMYFCIY